MLRMDSRELNYKPHQKYTVKWSFCIMKQTDRTYVEQLEQENAKLRAALQDAQEANQAKTRFLSICPTTSAPL